MRSRGWELVANGVPLFQGDEVVPDHEATFAFLVPCASRTPHAIILAHRRGVLDFYQVVHALPVPPTKRLGAQADAEALEPPRLHRGKSGKAAVPDASQTTLHSYFASPEQK